MAALALLANGVIKYCPLCKIRRQDVVADYVLNDTVGLVQGLDFTPLGFVNDKMVISAYFKRAIVKAFVNVVYVSQHIRFKPNEWLLVTLR